MDVTYYWAVSSDSINRLYKRKITLFPVHQSGELETLLVKGDVVEATPEAEPAATTASTAPGRFGAPNAMIPFRSE